MNFPEAIILIGAKQVGKTSIMRLLKNGLKKEHKTFFFDFENRNILPTNFNSIESRNDRSALLENGIYNELMKNIDRLDEIKYWRTKSGNEVDFIIDGEKKYAF